LFPKTPLRGHPISKSYATLNLYLLIFINLIFDSRVDGGMPSLSAAPIGPDTQPRVSAKAAPIIFRSSNSAPLESSRVAASLWRHSYENFAKIGRLATEISYTYYYLKDFHLAIFSQSSWRAFGLSLVSFCRFCLNTAC